MNRFMIFFLASLAAVLLLVACEKSDSKTLLVTEENIESLIVMEVGDILDVSLEGNPSTGYGWEMLQVDQPVLFQVGDIDFQSSSSLIGSSGRVTLHFEAVKAGQQRLELIYHRPWERDIPPLMIYTLEVEVK